MKRHHLHLRSACNNPGNAWETPAWLFQMLDKVFQFTMDACALPETAKTEMFFTPEEDGLSKSWSGRVWMNPPYGREIVRWVRKAVEESEAGRCLVVGLLPAKTDTAWWQDWVTRGHIHFIRGRLRFEGAKNAAPFPSALVLWCPKPEGTK